MTGVLHLRQSKGHSSTPSTSGTAHQTSAASETEFGLGFVDMIFPAFALDMCPISSNAAGVFVRWHFCDSCTRTLQVARPPHYQGPRDASPLHFVVQMSAEGSECNVRFEPLLTAARHLEFAHAACLASSRTAQSRTSPIKQTLQGGLTGPSFVRFAAHLSGARGWQRDEGSKSRRGTKFRSMGFLINSCCLWSVKTPLSATAFRVSPIVRTHVIEHRV